MLDAVVIGSGPNGLAAAAELARAGRSVRVLEAEPTLGGGCRSAELTLPGFVHDQCSAIHPMGAISRVFKTLNLDRHGLEWIHPDAPLAHPLDGGRAVLLERSLSATCAGLGADGQAYARLFGPLVKNGQDLLDDLFRPLQVPRHPLLLARFGVLALRPATSLARSVFQEEGARALFAGDAAHAVQPLTRPLTAAFGLVFGILGHVSGWPLARGGSQRIADALVQCLTAAGGQVVTERRVRTLGDVPDARVILFDTTPRQLLGIARDRLPGGYVNRLARFRYGPGIFKLDYALDSSVPWQAPACARAGTVHLGGTLDEITAAEAAVARGEHPERPFVIVAQQSLFDPARAPAGKHTLWAYCHVPHGSTVDMAERIEQQIERFAPGFRARIIARASMSPADVERHNSNYIGGDITGGVHDFGQLLTRPVPRLVPWSTPNPRLFLCSSSTPPGAGVHGLCGHFAAQAVLRQRHLFPRTVRT